jgi:Gpi18-like mannosyltransferase
LTGFAGHWVTRVLAIFVASRVVTTTIFLVVASLQQVSDRTGEHPGFFEFANIWDGQWYWFINAAGYPDEVPRTDEGHAQENAWAFMPAYPLLLRLLTVIGIPFPVIAPIVSLLFAGAAALVFYRLMVRFLPPGSALFATALFCTAPLSTILQVSYAESMHLFLLFLALLLLVDRRYALLVPVVVVMSLTRPSGLAFALALLLHLVHRFVTRARDPFPWRERVEVVVVGLVSAFAGVAWLLIAWAVTGEFTAYTDTEFAWRRGFGIDGDLIPFTPWVQGAEFWFDDWFGLPEPWSLIAGVAALIALVGGYAGFLLSPAAKRLGPDVRFWLIAYALYLLAVFFPQSSTFRLLVPLAPALGALAVPTSWIWRVSLLVVGVAGQVVWTYGLWRADVYDWTPP